MTHPDKALEITDSICGPYPNGIENSDANYKRMVIFGLVGHYLGMAEQPYMSPAWRAENSGWCNTINAVEGAAQISALEGGDALDKMGISNWPRLVIDACHKAGVSGDVFEKPIEEQKQDGKNTR